MGNCCKLSTASSPILSQDRGPDPDSALTADMGTRLPPYGVHDTLVIHQRIWSGGPVLLGRIRILRLGYRHHDSNARTGPTLRHQGGRRIRTPLHPSPWAGLAPGRWRHAHSKGRSSHRATNLRFALPEHDHPWPAVGCRRRRDRVRSRSQVRWNEQLRKHLRARRPRSLDCGRGLREAHQPPRRESCELC